MIFITSPISYGLIALVCFIGFLRSRHEKENRIIFYFNKLFFWFSLYGFHWTIVSIITLITKGNFPFSWQTYPLGHLLAFIGIAYGIRVGLYTLNIKPKKASLIIALYFLIVATGLVINIIYPSILTFKDYGYVFIDANSWVGRLWTFPLGLAILFLAAIFWWQGLKKATEPLVRKKAMFIAAAFSIIALGAPIRNIFEGFYIAVVSEFSLSLAMIIVVASLFLKEKK